MAARATDTVLSAERLWLARNKPEGIWLTLDGFDVAAQVLDRWIARVQPHYGWGQ